jgi:ABC-type sugar transport system substrate-binding protein
MGRDKVTIFNKNQEVENWERRKSQEICSKILERRGAQIDGLFCCNDDIALGARNAILITKKTGIIRPEKKIRIVGFDLPIRSINFPYSELQAAGRAEYPTPAVAG